MLQELEAIVFERQITVETRTHPWVVLAHRPDSMPEPYVVKLFSKDEVEQNYAVAKEVFANVIAGEFELSRPEPALIDLNKGDFITSLTPEQINYVYSKDYRIKFGTKYIKGTLPYNKNVNLDNYSNFGDIDSIFAFDNFIHNCDRTEGKPDNIRFSRDNYYLIDHEYSLAITQEIVEQFNREKWVYNYVNHIFYYYLLLQRDKTHLFQNFESKLSTFDPNILDSYELQLRDHQYNPPYEDYQLLKSYLSELARQSKKFLLILQKIVAA